MGGEGSHRRHGGNGASKLDFCRLICQQSRCLTGAAKQERQGEEGDLGDGERKKKKKSVLVAAKSSGGDRWRKEEGSELRCAITGGGPLRRSCNPTQTGCPTQRNCAKLHRGGTTVCFIFVWRGRLCSRWAKQRGGQLCWLAFGGRGRNELLGQATMVERHGSPCVPVLSSPSPWARPAGGPGSVVCPTSAPDGAAARNPTTPWHVKELPKVKAGAARHAG